MAFFTLWKACALFSFVVTNLRTGKRQNHLKSPLLASKAGLDRDSNQSPLYQTFVGAKNLDFRAHSDTQSKPRPDLSASSEHYSKELSTSTVTQLEVDIKSDGSQKDVLEKIDKELNDSISSQQTPPPPRLRSNLQSKSIVTFRL